MTRSTSDDPRLSDDSWIQTASGIPFWITNPLPSDVDIGDIATALSRLPRFLGHTSGFYAYSVAQHSVLVARNSDPQDRLWGLLHDASEAYICDLPRPLKRLPEFAPYREAESRVMRAVCGRFGLSDTEPDSVRIADSILLATEARDLIGNQSWVRRMGVDPLPETIYPVPDIVARRWFLDMFTALMEQKQEV